jgi:Na+-transporting NADH:ubiquinone oxidoreductase subunit C
VGKELKVIAFAAAVCLICSLLLAAVYSGLKPLQDRNKALDVKIKVLTALGVKVANESGKVTKSAAEIEEMFSAQIEGLVIDSDGKLVDVAIADLTEEQINKRRDNGLKLYYPLYVATDPDSGRKRYAIHVSGRALWSVVKGYMALEEDGSTIAGMAFYEHQETPGLGGEIEKPFFQNSFREKKFLSDGKVQLFRILKPGQPTGMHSIEGITAATMTCNGVAAFLNDDFQVYHKYFESIRK